MQQKQDDDSETLGDYWRAHREYKKERKQHWQLNFLPEDLKLLSRLPVHVVNTDDGAGGTKAVITVETDRGPRLVDFWHSTGLWKVRVGRAEGYGMRRFKAYFRLQENP